MTNSRESKRTVIFSLLLLFLLNAGCQPQTPASVEIATPTATLSQLQEARLVLDNYYTALINRDYAEAAALFTTRVGIDRENLLRIWEDRDSQGWRLTGYEITRQQQYDNARIVFWVTLTQEGDEPPRFDTINVLHLEEAGWFVGNAMLDKIAIQDRPHFQDGVTVVTGVFLRYVEGYAFWFNIQNERPETLIWGREGEICGTLLFAAYTVQSPCSTSTPIHSGEEANVSLFFSDDVLSRPVNDLPTNLQISSFFWDVDLDGSPDPEMQPWSFQVELRYDNR
jgi:hypothetical protein